MSQKLGTTPSVLACVTEIIAAHLSNNAVPMADVPGFIRSVHATMTDLEQTSGTGPVWPGADLAGQGGSIFHLSDVQPLIADGTADAQRPVRRPAVPIEESVQPGYIVCLEDGKRLRMLKRYLRTHFGLSPDEYRTRWNLPTSYPMAAPEVVEQRRAHAKTAGLGRKPLARYQPAGKGG